MNKDSESETERLKREWMASEHWGGWRAGMKSRCGRIYIEGLFFGRESLPLATMVPDLDHPGTRAFLLEDVRRAWASEGAVNWQSGPEWHYVVRPGYQFFNPGALYGKGKTEQAALIAALRAAP